MDFLKLKNHQKFFLLGGVSFWFLGYVRTQRRDYLDAWVLDDVFWPFLVFLLVFLGIVIYEKEIRMVAVYSALAAGVAGLVPALKYTQLYGTTIDVTSHFILVENLYSTGRVIEGHIYASINALHTMLASVALLGGLTPEQVIKYGMPLLAAFIPLMVYMFVTRIRLPQTIARYVILSSCLIIYPQFAPNGTAFSLLPLFLILGLVAIGDTYIQSASLKRLFAIVILLLMVQLVLWHSTTPIILPILLASGALAPAVEELVLHRNLRVRINRTGIFLMIISAVLFFGYHFSVSDRVGQVMVQSIRHQFTGEKTPVEEELGQGVEEENETAPDIVYTISAMDYIRTGVVLHGRDLMMFGLMLVGGVILLGHSEEFSEQGPFYIYLFLITLPFGIFILLNLEAGYLRFLKGPLIVSPFFAGISLWWFFEKRIPRFGWNDWVVGAVAGVAILVVVTVWAVQFYWYQPLVPKIDAQDEAFVDEYTLWLHEVNTAYQLQMMTFAETYASQDARFAIDLRGRHQFIRYFGDQAGLDRGLYLPLKRSIDIQPEIIQLFLLHLPGPAGGLGERISNRSDEYLLGLQQMPYWNMVYDNGESFILNITSAAGQADR